MCGCVIVVYNYDLWNNFEVINKLNYGFNEFIESKMNV